MESPAARYVPGAPPPAPLTKSQKKKLLAKRKPGDSPAEPRNISPDVQHGLLGPTVHEVAGPDSVTPSEPKAPTEDEIPHKPSPMVELIHKRLKATTKKIVSFKLNFRLALDVHCTPFVLY
jgi:hypothetical protein